MPCFTWVSNELAVPNTFSGLSVSGDSYIFSLHLNATKKKQAKCKEELKVTNDETKMVLNNIWLLEANILLFKAKKSDLNSKSEKIFGLSFQQKEK